MNTAPLPERSPIPDLVLLDRWPDGRPVGLVIMTPLGSDPLADAIHDRIGQDPLIRDWWLARPENMIAGPSIDPDFGWVFMLDIRHREAAREIVEEVAAMPGVEGTIIHLASPPPARTMRWVHILQALLNKLPAPRTGGPPILESEWLGGSNPTRAQAERIESLPQKTPIGVLNMHRYRAQATDPDTGKAVSGRELAGRYLKRGFLTFSRLGGRTLWMAGGKGQIMGPPTPRWHEIAMIWYPSRASFRRLSENPAFARTMPYRKEGLECANVWHTHIIASSRRRDVR